MIIQFDKFRTVEIEPTEKWKYFVLTSPITSNEVKIASRHRTYDAAIRAAKNLQTGDYVKVYVDGMCISRNAYYKWKE